MSAIFADNAPQTPNTGRILDYWLGGVHHHEIDVAGAKQFEAVYDGFPAVFKSLRSFIGRAVRHIESAGIDQFLVLGAGLPTCGNVHEVVPDSNVLYTDIDFENVRLGNEILSGNPRTGYTYCDATDMATLDRVEMSRMLELSQPVGLVFVGASAFMSDAVLRTAMRRLYDWAPAGSMLVLDFDGEALSGYPQALLLLDRIGAPLYMRNPDVIAPLLAPWRLQSPGILPADAWPHASAKTISPDQVFMFGCVVHKAPGDKPCSLD